MKKTVIVKLISVLTVCALLTLVCAPPLRTYAAEKSVYLLFELTQDTINGCAEDNSVLDRLLSRLRQNKRHITFIYRTDRLEYTKDFASSLIKITVGEHGITVRPGSEKALSDFNSAMKFVLWRETWILCSGGGYTDSSSHITVSAAYSVSSRAAFDSALASCRDGTAIEITSAPAAEEIFTSLPELEYSVISTVAPVK